MSQRILEKRKKNLDFFESWHVAKCQDSCQENVDKCQETSPYQWGGGQWGGGRHWALGNELGALNS